MKSTNVKKSLFSILLCLTLLVSLKAQDASNNTGEEVYLDKLPDIKIEKLIFYQNPLFVEYGKLADNYTPEWYPAFCANGYYDYFKDNPYNAVKYYHSISGFTKEKLSESIQNVIGGKYSRQDLYPNPYEYIFGEIWFIYKKTNERIGIVMGYLPPNKINNFKFKTDQCENKDISNFPFINMANYVQPFIYEDDLLKRADPPYVFNKVLKNKELIIKGMTFESFSVLLKNAPTYVRSRLINDKRIFETVKNTPNGPVVVNQ